MGGRESGNLPARGSAARRRRHPNREGLAMGVSGELGSFIRMALDRPGRSSMVRCRWSGKAPRPASDRTTIRSDDAKRLDAECVMRGGMQRGRASGSPCQDGAGITAHILRGGLGEAYDCLYGYKIKNRWHCSETDGGPL